MAVSGMMRARWAGARWAVWRWEFTELELGFEVDYAISRNNRSENFRGYTQYLLANGLVHFARGKARPYFLFGGGMAIHTNTGAYLGSPRTGVGPAVAIGFGLKGFINEHWFIRPEVRVSGGWGSGLRKAIESPATVPRITIGAGYRW